MREHSKVDLILAVAIVCIAVTLTIVLAFAASEEPYEMHRVHHFAFTEESRQ